MNDPAAIQALDAFEALCKRLREIVRQLPVSPIAGLVVSPTPPPDNRLLLRPSEVAEALGVGRSKVYELIATGAIPSITLGGCVRVPLEPLRAWIAQQVDAQKRQ